MKRTLEQPTPALLLWLWESRVGYVLKGPAGSNLLPPVCVVLSPGCLGTAAALTYGLYCFHRGQSHRSQIMMRTRIAAQGFTVVAILLGLAASAMKSRP